MIRRAIIVSETPAILVAIDGAPVIQPVPGTSFERVINTRALILREQGESTLLSPRLRRLALRPARSARLLVPALVVPPGIDQVAAKLAASGTVDMLDGGNAKPKPVARRRRAHDLREPDPAELIVFKGEPTFTSIPGHEPELGHEHARGRDLRRRRARVYYVLLSGRWYRSPAR